MSAAATELATSGDTAGNGYDGTAVVALLAAAKELEDVCVGRGRFAVRVGAGSAEYIGVVARGGRGAARCSERWSLERRVRRWSAERGSWGIWRLGRC